VDFLDGRFQLLAMGAPSGDTVGVFSAAAPRERSEGPAAPGSRRIGGAAQERRAPLRTP
jgi:hypothetical protein